MNMDLSRFRRIARSAVTLAFLCGFDLYKFRIIMAVRRHSQLNFYRLANTYDLAQRLRRSSVAGSFVECGVWRGGCVAIMAVIAASEKKGRMTWIFDSFEGMPEPTHEDGAVIDRMYGGRFKGLREGKLIPIGMNEATQDQVEELLFTRLGLSRDSLAIRKGWFQNTVPLYKRDIGPIALLRIDSDWYASTKICLETLYESVVPGGYIIIDDYLFFEGCRKAVDEFLASAGVDADIIPIDTDGVYFRKP